MTLRAAALLSLIAFAAAPCAGVTELTMGLTPGTPAEEAALMLNNGSAVSGGVRRAEVGGGWIYALTMPPGAKVELRLVREGRAQITLADSAAVKVPCAVTVGGQTVYVRFTVPAAHPVGGRIRVKVKAAAVPLAVSSVEVRASLPDNDGDGVSDLVERLLGDPSGERVAPAAVRDAPSILEVDATGQPTTAWTPPARGERSVRLTLADVAAPVRAMGIRKPRPYAEACLRAALHAAAARQEGRPLRLELPVAAPNDPAAALAADALAGALAGAQGDLFAEQGSVPGAGLPAGLRTALAGLWVTPPVEPAAGRLGLLVGDPLSAPNSAPMEALRALYIPLAENGAAPALIRSDMLQDASALRGISVLIVSFAVEAPKDAAAVRSLAEWARAGGVLLVIGADADTAPDAGAWWQAAGQPSATAALFAQAGLQGAVPHKAAPTALDLPIPWVEAGALAEAAQAGQWALDLASPVLRGGDWLLRLEPGAAGLPLPAVESIDLRVAGRPAVAFRCGTETETRFLWDDDGTIIAGNARTPAAEGAWTYRFASLPGAGPARLTLRLRGACRVSVAAAPPAGPLLEAEGAGLGALLATVRAARPEYVAPCGAPSGATLLLKVRQGGEPAAWEAPCGKGRVAYAGLDPLHFGSSVRAARLLRALVRRAFDRTDGQYAEAGLVVWRRGSLVTAHAALRPQQVDGAYVDLLDADLSEALDPSLQPGTSAVLAEVPPGRRPRVAASDRPLVAVSEGLQTTGYAVAAGPEGRVTTRISRGRSRPTGAKAFSLWGEPLAVQVQENSRTVAVRVAAPADGAVVRLGWKR